MKRIGLLIMVVLAIAACSPTTRSTDGGIGGTGQPMERL